MATIKISDLSTRVGTAVISVGGKIVSVFPEKQGKGAKGAWKLQNIYIEDETGKIKATIWNCPTVNESDKGQDIEFFSTGSKGKLTGTFVKLNEYTDKNGVNKSELQLDVSKKDYVKFRGWNESVQESPEEPSQDQERKTATELNKTLENHFKTKTGKTPQERIKQFELLYDICFASAQNTNAVVSVTSQELIKDIATTFFIQAVREGLADKMEVEEHDAF